MMKDLTFWLRKTPQPVAILADDKRIEVPKNGRAWKDLTATIKALAPSKLTALDGQGNVIRVVLLEEEEDKPAPASPPMTDLQLFATLLAEAYDRGSRSTQPVIDSAMQFTERQAQRLLKTEAENDRLRTIIHKQHLQILELTNNNNALPGAEDSIMGALVAGALQAEAAKAAGAPPPAPKNGAQKK